MRFIKRIRLPLITACILATVSTQHASASQPNVVVIYFDDTGWTDFGCFGGDIDTPNIDRLADSGMRFTNYYAPAPNCSPSRAGLLTGRFPFRVGMYSYLPPDCPMHLPESEITLAEVLKQSGYATGMFGKWHLSKLKSQQPGPSDQGFDYWMACDNNMVKRDPDNLIRNGSPVGKTNGWAAQIVADEACNWMERQRQPFFAYIAFSETHSPHDAPEPLKEKYAERSSSKRRATYKGMTEYTDAAVGTIMAKLESMGVGDDTVVFLASDNGPTDSKSCEGLRGKKSFTWEGGVRVPAIVSWPGVVEAGAVSDAPVGGVDLLPTLCDMLDMELPDRTIDGVSIRDVLDQREFSRERPLLAFFYRTSPAASMRLGDYVLIAHSDDEARKKTHRISAVDMPLIKSTRLVSFELYNVRDDLAQANDLASEQPQQLSRLREIMIRLHQDAIDEGPIWDFSSE